MSIVFDRNIEAAEFLLNTILERKDIEVLEVIGQREYKNEHDPIGKLVHDLNCKKSKDAYYPILAKQLHYF